MRLIDSRRFTLLGLSVLIGFSTAIAADPPNSRRILKAALYPYVPQKEAMFWKLEQAFEAANPDVDLQVVDLSANYYGGELLKALGATSGNATEIPPVDVAEVDSVFLRDLVDQKLIEKIPDSALARASEFLPVATSACLVDETAYGIPHWVCGNFVFCRADDPDAAKIAGLQTLTGLEEILGVSSTSDPSGSLLVDLHGKSTLGEEYLDAVLDAYPDPAQALSHVDPTVPEAGALSALRRVFLLTPGNTCLSEKHHDYGQYYPRQFAHRKARTFIGYSEDLYYVLDEYIHGIDDAEPAVGKMHFDYVEATGKYDIWSEDDIRAVSAPLSDSGSHPLAWVDVLALKNGLTEQTRNDALALIELYNSAQFTKDILMPTYGEAPRYLMPARESLYSDPAIVRAAPLYPSFLKVMKSSIAVSAPGLNDKLRTIGKGIQSGTLFTRP